MGYSYGSDDFVSMLRSLLSSITNACYRASALLAREKGAFPLYKEDPYLDSKFILSLDTPTQDLIAEHGIRNSHLVSIAPTGTISFAADNISSGIEPVFSHNQIRSINGATGPYMVEIQDYGVRFLGVRGKTAADCSAEEHLQVITACAPYIDSAVSKTLNVPKDIPWDEFKSVYLQAWKAGCKGCTTHRTGNLRGAVIQSADNSGADQSTATACEIDPNTGKRDCS
jgi:ribonucleoside-diphosphate reductase alpha chain